MTTSNPEFYVSHTERLLEIYLAKAEKILGRNINPCSEEAGEAYDAMRDGIAAEQWAEEKQDNILSLYALPGGQS